MPQASDHYYTEEFSGLARGMDTVTIVWGVNKQHLHSQTCQYHHTSFVSSYSSLSTYATSGSGNGHGPEPPLPAHPKLRSKRTSARCARGSDPLCPPKFQGPSQACGGLSVISHLNPNLPLINVRDSFTSHRDLRHTNIPAADPRPSRYKRRRISRLDTPSPRYSTSYLFEDKVASNTFEHENIQKPSLERKYKTTTPMSQR